MQITNESVIKYAASMGVVLEALGEWNEYHHSWSVRNVGHLALLMWFDDKGFKYSTKPNWKKRWRVQKRGKQLRTVLTTIRDDVRRHAHEKDWGKWK